MASSSVLLILIFTSLGWLFPARSASRLDPDAVTLTDLSVQLPHITGCKSREQVTFTCSWSAGSFQNLTEPGALQLFYWKKTDLPNVWRDCPEYSSSVKNECFFNRNNTAVWTKYCVKLRSESQNISYDNYCFELQDIVHPYPPMALNWTLLNISRSGLYYDIMVRWEPSPSADLSGWLSVMYEVQYRKRNSSHWKVLELEPGTQKLIYGLRTEDEYEVRVHCAMRAFNNFGEFSDVIIVYIPEIPNKDSTFPMTLVLIFGAVGLAIVFMLIIFSQQHRLMVILLPPVPAPKIKGIDPELLKRGKMDELNFILSGNGVGGLHSYPPDLYQDEHWVEFIELDADDPEPGDKEDQQASDTRRLLGLGRNQHRNNRGCSHNLGIPEEDSGRSSCYDPEMPDQDTLMLMAALLSNQPNKVEPCLGNQSNSNIPASEAMEVTSPGPRAAGLAPDRGEKSLVHSQQGCTQSWVNIDFYAQVSNVTPTGGVVLSPGQQVRVPENAPMKKEETKTGKRDEGEEAKSICRNVQEFQLQVMDPEEGGYTTEPSVRQMDAPNATSFGEVYHTFPPPPAVTKPHQEAYSSPSTPQAGLLAPYILPDSPPAQFLPPVSDYTVVQDVDSQHSLLLNPPSPQNSASCTPQPPTKAPPTMPIGYLTPDLLGNLLP